MTTRTFGFERLLHPLTREDFVRDHWERAPLHLRRQDPGYYQGLMRMADLDHVIATGPDQPDFTLALLKDGAITHQTGAGGAFRFGVDDVYDAFAKGSTIRVFRIDRHLPALRVLAGDVERHTSCEVNVNVYLTPGRSRGFGRHYDSHDVLILQLAGRKHWKLYEPPADLPMENLAGARRQLFARPLHYQDELPQAALINTVAREIVLEPGDLLYLPRGHVHEAYTGDELSLHLTVGMVAITWHEAVAHALVRHLPEDRLLRTGLPPGFAADGVAAGDLAGCSEKLTAAVAAALAPDRLAAAVEELAERFVYSRRPLYEGQLEDIGAAEEVGTGTRLRIRPGTADRLREDGGSLYLLFSGRCIKLPARVRSMVEHMQRVREFTVGELPGQLGDESRLLLVQHLLRKGFLCRSPGP